jgi:hypothetical protein
VSHFKIFCIVTCCFVYQYTFSQGNTIIMSDSLVSISEFNFDPNGPSRAAFYSAILPGLGQAYNKKYWKIPIIYAALGTGIYVYKWNNDNYNRYRDAYKLSVSGKPHEFDENSDQFLSDEGLKRAQRQYKEDRDLSLLVTIGLYALQIVEASVNAHLMQMNNNNKLSFNPKFIIDPVTYKATGGLSISFTY